MMTREAVMNQRLTELRPSSGHKKEPLIETNVKGANNRESPPGLDNGGKY